MESNDAAIAGIDAQIDLYKKNEKLLSSDKELKKMINNFISMKKKKKLREYVKEILAPTWNFKE